MGQAKQRGTKEQRVTAALEIRQVREAAQKVELEARKDAQKLRKAAEESRIAALTPEQRKRRSIRPINMVSMLIALGTVGAGFNK